MEISMQFFLVEPLFKINWDVPNNVITTPFGDFLGLHEGKYISREVAQRIGQRWNEWANSEEFKIQFERLIQCSEPSTVWKDWLFGHLQQPGEVTFCYSESELISQLARIGNTRLEFLEKALRRMEFNLNRQFKRDTFDSCERKRNVREAQKFCSEVRDVLLAGKIWAIQKWNYSEIDRRFYSGQFMESFTTFSKTPAKPKQRVLALFYIYLQMAGVIPEFGQSGQTKKEEIKGIGDKYKTSPNRFEQVYNGLTKTADRTNPVFIGDLEAAIKLLTESPKYEKARAIAEDELKIAQAKKK